VLASTTLSNGVGTLSVGPMAPGSHSFVGSYSGDSLHEAATSAPVSMTVPAVACGVRQPPTVRMAGGPVRAMKGALE
jgi:hypothetical protein